MTREDIIRMAREAGAAPYTNRHYPDRTTHTFSPDQLERFAALIGTAERNRTWTQEHWTEYEHSIAATEREACANVCDEFESDTDPDAGAVLAAAIRARGQA